MNRPRMLDLFCGLGGAAMGYHRAGFEVVGVDIKHQRNYPFEFHQGDALTFPLEGFDFVHASPPCQEYSWALRGLVKHGNYEKLLEATRERLAPVPHVIENVPGAPIPNQSVLWGNPGLMLCGSMFDVGIVTPSGYREVRRHRLFESTVHLYAPGGCRHRFDVISPYNADMRRRDGITHQADAWYGRAMGIDWVDRGDGNQIREAIPPAYTEWIGRQLIEEMEHERDRKAQ